MAGEGLGGGGFRSFLLCILFGLRLQRGKDDG
jgi:hypothetical protein